MALLTKAAVDTQIAESFDSLITLSGKYNVDSMKNKILSQIQNLQKKESIFLKAVNAENLEQVNQRLQQYKKDYPKIQNLSGPSLYWEFLNTIEAEQSYIEDQKQKEFVDFFSQIEVEGLAPEEDLVKWFHTILNSVSIGSVHSTKGYEQATELQQIILKRLTAQQKRRVAEFMSGKRKEFKKGGPSITVKQTSQSVATSFSTTNWATLTQNQKSSEIEEQLKTGRLTQKQLDNIIKQLYSIIVAKGPSNNYYFRSAVGEVLFEKNSKTKIFYAGNMMNGITGLLGEIQALFFMKSLLNDAGDTQSQISWVGGINNPHEDLILSALGEQIGIQVKNSYKNLESLGQMADVSFMSKAAVKFSEVEKAMGADYNDIRAIYEMDAFNIEYIKEGSVYKPGPNDAFSNSRDNIEFLSHEADRIMTLFAGAMMYMAVGEEFSEVPLGNSVYILGGATMRFASEILLSIFSKLEHYEKDFGFKITAYFNKGKSGVGTIADYFNTVGRKHGGSVSKSLGQLFLQSSYTFEI